MSDTQGHTRHVHHPAVACLHHCAGLAVQATGTDAVRVISRDQLPRPSATVTPGLGQVGQLGAELGHNLASLWVDSMQSTAGGWGYAYPLLLA